MRTIQNIILLDAKAFSSSEEQNILKSLIRIHSVNLLLDGLDVENKTKIASLFLGPAIAIVDANILKSLLESGADINFKSSSGKSLLELAVDSGSRGCVKLLIDSGADINHPTINGFQGLSTWWYVFKKSGYTSKIAYQ